VYQRKEVSDIVICKSVILRQFRGCMVAQRRLPRPSALKNAEGSKAVLKEEESKDKRPMVRQ
jgi:hypothetical protein